MINTNDVDTLVTHLFKENKNILILDTCVLLDIVRAVERDQVGVIKSILTIGKDIDSPFILVIPERVLTEWKDNIDGVGDEFTRFIKNTQSKINSLGEIVKLLQLQKSTYIPNYIQYSIPQLLRDKSQICLESCLIIQENDKLINAGSKRVLNNLPPSKKGKDSTKDCIIYESSLFVGKKLKEYGFSKKVVFCSSNTKEFDFQEIRDELSDYNMDYAVNLEHGFSIVSD